MTDATRASSLLTTDLDRAVDALQGGGLVAIPTETVYGLAADATNADAVMRIFEIKERPQSHPLIVHLSAVDQIDEWTVNVDAAVRDLATAMWPGPLTMILERADDVLDEVTGGRKTVGVRVPAHDMTLGLLELLGRGVAAPSANRFGSVSPTTALHVIAELGDRLDPKRDAILDGGPCRVGLESSIVDCTTDPPQLLRAGSIAPTEISRILGDLADAVGPTRASGMFSSHYAPRCVVKLVDTPDDARALRSGTHNCEILDRSDDLVVYARELYGALRDADDRGVSTVIAVLPPAEGLGLAIRDRLGKAAAPRDRSGSPDSSR